MFLVWVQNGKERVWNLSEKGITRKLRKALKNAVGPLCPEYDKLSRAKNVADMHYAIYTIIGATPAIQSFQIVSRVF